jgi:drug/metabolite transporter (DMT)-like permease
MLERLTQRTNANAYLLLTLTTLFWAGNHTVGRWAAGHVPPVTLAFLRWTGAALIVLAFAWSEIRREWPVARAALPILLALGIIGPGLFNTLQYIALTGTTASNAGIINSASPIMIAVLSFHMNGERVHMAQVAGILVSLLGVMAVLTHGDVSAIFRLDFNSGDLVMLGAMLVWALYTGLLEKRPPLSALSFTALTYTIAALVNAPLAAVEIGSGVHIAWSPASAAAIAYTAIFPSLLAYAFFNLSVEIIGPTRAGFFMHLVPMFTVLLAIVFLGEQPALYHAAGLSLILTGVWLAARAGDDQR